MAKYTAELRTLIDNDIDIFDFEYTRSSDSQAIVSDEDLEQGFINHFYFREIGFETLERFKHKIKTQWLESLGEFDKLLVAYNEDINVKSNVGTNTKSVSKYNDTPKNSLDFGEQSTHATSITDGLLKNTGYANMTEIELLDIYRRNIQDIQTNFYNSFDNLFMQIF